MVRSAGQVPRYGNYVPTDNQNVIIDRHINRVKRRLNLKGFINDDLKTLSLFGFAPHELRSCINRLRLEGLLITSETFKKRNKWGELIHYRRYRLIKPE